MQTLDLNIRKVFEYRWDMPAKRNVVPQTTLGDFNKDGKTDFALSMMDIDGSTNDLRLFLATKDGFVDGTKLIPNPEPTYQSSNILSVDLNKDGQTDLVISRSGGDGDTLANGGIAGATQLIYLSNSNGEYTAVKSSASPYAHNVMIEDFDGDGDIDAFYFATGVGPSLIALNNLDKTNTISFGTDGLPSKTVKVSGSERWDILELYPNGAIKKAEDWHNHNAAFNDIDRDGDLDMVLFFAGSSKGKIYLNDSKGNFNVSPAQTYDATIPGIPSSGNFIYGILNNDGSWKGLNSVKQGANYYETIQFDVNGDGWKDIIAVATLENHDYINVGNGQIYQNGTDNKNHGTFYSVLINNASGLSNETFARVSQPAVTTKTNYHYGHYSMLSAVDLNGDGYLDFSSEQNSSVINGQANWAGESDTVFMLNSKDGKFSQIGIKGLQYGSFDPLPIAGKLGFSALTVPTDHDWKLPNAPPRPWASFDFYITDIPWTIGDAKNNYLYGTVADDLIDGAEGIDTFCVNGRSDEFKLSFTSQWRLMDVTGLYGADKLNNVERIQFFDKTIALDTEANAGQTYRVYKAAFNRTPDNGGLKYWIQQMDGGKKLSEVASGFIESNEFKALYGANPSNDQFVAKLYNNVLGRAPDTGGFNYWVGLLNNKQIDMTNTLVNFSESPENQAGVIGVIQNGIELLN